MAEQTKTASEIEALQKRIAEVELETKLLLLTKTEREIALMKAEDAQRHKSNQMRQAELRQLREARQAVINPCRHKSGGRPDNIMKGGGVGSFSIITRAVMPDGVTLFLQCARCRLALYTPERPVGKDATPTKMKQYAEEMDKFNALLEASIDAGFDNIIRPPTFAFKNADGVPMIPARV